MKYFLVGTFFVLILFGLSGAALLAYPYYLYYQGINLQKVVSNHFVSIDVENKGLLKLSPYKFPEIKGVYQLGENRWNDFHFSDFYIPLPKTHPFFKLIPIIEFENKTVSLGGRFEDQNKDNFFEFRTGENTELDFSIPREKIFYWPQFENIKNKKTSDEIYHDFLKMDLYLPYDESIGLLKNYEILSKISYGELFYRLYILKLRQRNFNKKGYIYQFDDTKNAIVLTPIVISNDIFQEEIFFLKSENKLFKMKIKYKKNDILSLSAFKKIYDTIYIKKSEKESFKNSYGQFTLLPYQRKLSYEGALLMYVSWTHLIKERVFLKRSIQFLEKNNDNYNFLIPLYDYAYQVFSTNFSKIESRRRESNEERLKRLLEEEEENISKNQLIDPIDLPEKSNKELLKETLKEVKEKKINSDQDDGMLIKN